VTNLIESLPSTVCPECMDYYFSSPGLIHACASVGIERGLSTGEMLGRYLDAYHRRGHKALAEPAQQGDTHGG
jgi:hypothetical protein